MTTCLPTVALTLIIPTYNRANLIIETIDCALNQEMPFAEIIVINDGSTDNTLEVLASYKDSITIINTANRGVQAARNTGIAAAATDLIALCDSDDLLLPTFTRRAFTWMKSHAETDIYYCNFTVFDSVGLRYDKFATGPADYFAGAEQDGDTYFNIPNLYLKNLKFQPLFQVGTVINKLFFNRIGGYDTNFKGVVGEDWEFSLRAILMGQVAVCSTSLAFVRKHNDNDSGDNMYMNLGDAKILEHSLAKHPGAGKYKNDIKAAIDKRRVAAFDDAYARANFTLARDILSMLQVCPSNLKFKIKRHICYMPSIFQKWVWRLTQII